MDDGRNLPVLAQPPEARVIERQRAAGREPEQMPLSAPVAAATSGVLAGLATMALFRALRGGFGGGRRGNIRLGRRRGKMKIAQSQSFLIDVHLLKR
jgi:hypothetical protein